MAADAACALGVEEKLAAAGRVARMLASVAGVCLAIGWPRLQARGRRWSDRVAEPRAARRAAAASSMASFAAVHDAAHLEEAVKLPVVAPGLHAHTGRAEPGGIGLAFVAQRVELGRQHECRRQPA